MERQERQDASPAGEVLGEIVWLPEQAAKIVRNWRMICRFLRTAIAIPELAGSGNACHY